MLPPLQETKNQAFEHAWKWFEYHASQRMTTIRFYLVVAGAIATGIGYLWTAKYFLFAMILSAFGVVASICFLRLDTRVSHLVKLGEAALKRQQGQIAEALELPEIEICERADRLKNSNGCRKFSYPYTYSENISVLVGASTIAFIVAGLVCLLAAGKMIAT
jgi:hypothetical protein